MKPKIVDEYDLHESIKYHVDPHVSDPHPSFAPAFFLRFDQQSMDQVLKQLLDCVEENDD